MLIFIMHTCFLAAKFVEVFQKFQGCPKYLVYNSVILQKPPSIRNTLNIKMEEPSIKTLEKNIQAFSTKFIDHFFVETNSFFRVTTEHKTEILTINKLILLNLNVPVYHTYKP